MQLIGTDSESGTRASATRAGAIYQVYGILIGLREGGNQLGIWFLICDDNYKDTGFPVYANGHEFKVCDGSLAANWEIWLDDTIIRIGSPLQNGFPMFMERVTEHDPDALRVWECIKADTEAPVDGR